MLRKYVNYVALNLFRQFGVQDLCGAWRDIHTPGRCHGFVPVGVTLPHGRYFVLLRWRFVLRLLLFRWRSLWLRLLPMRFFGERFPCCLDARSGSVAVRLPALCDLAEHPRLQSSRLLVLPEPCFERRRTFFGLSS